MKLQFTSLFPLALSLLASCAVSVAFAAEPLPAVSELVENTCIDCHNASDKKGDLNLERFDARLSLEDATADTSVWEKIVRRLRAGQMPPADSPQPPREDVEAALAAMETSLDQYAKAHPAPGRTDSIRRMNRTEYGNAVRDLLQVEADVSELLPADQLSHGFDNVTVGELSPVLLSRYITAAEQISRIAVGALQRSPGGATFRLPPDRSQDSHVEGLPLGTRGGGLFEYHFPADGEYEIELRLMRDRDENIEGLSGQQSIDILLDLAPVHRFEVKPPKSGQGYQRDDTLVDALLKKRFTAAAGPHKIGVTFPQTNMSLQEIKRQPFDTSFNRHRHPRRGIALFQVSIVGPFDPEGPGDTPSRRQIFTVRPDENNNPEACAEQILRRLTRLAYRRPVTDQDLATPLDFFRTRNASDGFEAGIEWAISAILVNPHFLFRAENEPPNLKHGDVYRISDVELASRLSFFIWSSIPDEELLALAEAGELHKPEILRGQVERMLASPKSQSLVDNFAAQWLYLRNLKSFRPDMRLFPDFDDNLRHAMRRETELLFESILREDRSVLNLIKSDTTFLNERLATHYGIGNVRGSEFRPVAVSKESHRGGVLRHASILAVTSYSTRTSPTIRGSWILENILGTPPPPPPPNVPDLKEKTESANLTIRERLAEHRANPACASCHNLMDPVGFSLENFDAVGRWREFDDGQPIDADGALPDGTQVTSLEQLESGILSRPKMFVGALVEKLLTFALGRGVELHDGPAVRNIVETCAKDDYRFSSLIVEIASSPPFQMRVIE